MIGVSATPGYTVLGTHGLAGQLGWGCLVPTTHGTPAMNFASFEPVVIFTLLNVVMALGLNITAMSGQLSMATAAIAGVSGYAAAVLTGKFGWPFLPAVAPAALAGASVGSFLALLTLETRDFILKLTTLAFGAALAVLAFNWDYIGGANSFTGIGWAVDAYADRPLHPVVRVYSGAGARGRHARRRREGTAAAGQFAWPASRGIGAQ
jgi:ABC-type branched-subunit amino acid transport system permease subunit